MDDHAKIEKFKTAVLDRAMTPPPGSQAAPPDGHRIRAALHGLDGIIQQLEPLILVATPDAYDAFVKLGAAALHGLAGGNAPAPAA